MHFKKRVTLSHAVKLVDPEPGALNVIVLVPTPVTVTFEHA